MTAVTMALAVWLYPVDSDAAFAVHDAIWYGEQAQSSPLQSISPHHPLFHVFVLGLLQPLRVLGVAGPGHVAIRIVAGIGASWLILQICGLAGRRRLLVGAAFAFVILCSRGFIVELASGENVLPAAAAALFALTTAAKPNPSLIAAGAALTFAALMRQDNVFIAPGVAAALALGLEKGRRLRGIAAVAIGVGLATAAGYSAAGGGRSARVVLQVDRAVRQRRPLDRASAIRAFARRSAPVLGRADAHRKARGGGEGCCLDRRRLRGRHRGPGIPAARIGGALAPRRGDAGSPRPATALLRVVRGRELRMDGASGVAPRGVRVGSRARRARDSAGVAILLALSAWLLFSHGIETWKLRERRLMLAIERVADVDRSKWRFLATESRVGAALHLMGIPYTDLGRHRMTLDDVVLELAREQKEQRVPSIVIVDRFVMDGMPFTRKDGPKPWALDTIPNPPEWELVRWDGVTYAGKWTPSRLQPAPESGK
jgi:hypothetical protein